MGRRGNFSRTIGLASAGLALLAQPGCGLFKRGDAQDPTVLANLKKLATSMGEEQTAFSRASGPATYARLAAIFPAFKTAANEKEFSAVPASTANSPLGHKTRPFNAQAQYVLGKHIEALCENVDKSSLFTANPTLLMAGEAFPDDEAQRSAFVAARVGWAFPFRTDAAEVQALVTAYNGAYSGTFAVAGISTAIKISDAQATVDQKQAAYDAALATQAQRQAEYDQAAAGSAAKTAALTALNAAKAASTTAKTAVTTAQTTLQAVRAGGALEARKTVCTVVLNAPTFWIGTQAPADAVRRLAIELGRRAPTMQEYSDFINQRMTIQDFGRKLQSEPAYVESIKEWHRNWLSFHWDNLSANFDIRPAVAYQANFVGAAPGMLYRYNADPAKAQFSPAIVAPETPLTRARAYEESSGVTQAIAAQAAGNGVYVKVGEGRGTGYGISWPQSCDPLKDQLFDPRTGRITWEQLNPVNGVWETLGSWERAPVGENNLLTGAWGIKDGAVTLADGRTKRITRLSDLTDIDTTYLDTKLYTYRPLHTAKAEENSQTYVMYKSLLPANWIGWPALCHPGGRDSLKALTTRMSDVEVGFCAAADALRWQPCDDLSDLTCKRANHAWAACTKAALSAGECFTMKWPETLPLASRIGPMQKDRVCTEALDLKANGTIPGCFRASMAMLACDKVSFDEGLCRKPMSALVGTPLETFRLHQRRVRRFDPFGVEQNGMSEVVFPMSGATARVCNTVDRYVASCAMRPDIPQGLATAVLKRDVFSHGFGGPMWNPSVGKVFAGAAEWVKSTALQPRIVDGMRCGIPDPALIAQGDEMNGWKRGYNDIANQATLPTALSLQPALERRAEYLRPIVDTSQHLNSWESAAVDFPEVKAVAEIKSDIAQEPFRLVERILEDGLDYRLLVSAPYTYGGDHYEYLLRSQGYFLPGGPRRGRGSFAPAAGAAPHRIDFAGFEPISIREVESVAGDHGPNDLDGPRAGTTGNGAGGHYMRDLVELGTIRPKLHAGILTMPAFLSQKDPVFTGSALGMRTMADRYFARLMCGNASMFVPSPSQATIHEPFIPVTEAAAKDHLDRKKGCYSCHINMDPLASALSANFSLGVKTYAAGELRVMPGMALTTQANYAQGSVYGIRGGGPPSIGALLGERAEGLAGVSRILANSTQFNSCVVNRAMLEIYGREPAFVEIQSVSKVVERFMKHHNYNEMILDLISMPAFIKGD